MLEGRRQAIGIAALSLVPLLPALAQPFVRDDLNSIYQAAVTLGDPAHLWDPWMGGLARLIPKLLLMGLLAVAGPVSWLFRLHGFLWHAATVYLIARTVGAAYGRANGLWAAALFAAGFGYYAAAVVQVSNVTMSTALTLLLGSWRLWQLGRARLALVCFAAACLCHEAAWAAVLFIPFAVSAETARTHRVALAAVLIAFVAALAVPGWPRTYASTELEYWFFALFPLNASLGAFGMLPGSLARVGELAVAVRPWAGFAIALGFVALVLRGRGAYVAAVAWMVVLTLAFAAAITFWPEVWPPHWLDRRYLYGPAVGLCWLVATWLVGLGASRRRWAAAALLLWSLLWCELTIWSAARDAASPGQVEARARLAQEMAELDARWAR